MPLQVRRSFRLVLAVTAAVGIALTATPLAAGPARAAEARGAPGVLDVRAVRAFVEHEMERSGIPGLALGVVEGDRVVDLAGFGRADDGRPVTPRTPFLLASVSKPFTATAVMQLVEAGRVDLDLPVRRYLPEFRMADARHEQITVRHLLEHTSGIPTTSCDSRVEAATIEQYVAELRTVRLTAEPGGRHAYCSGNYNVLGRMIEVVSGQPFGAYLQRRVFEPLDMRNTFTSADEARRAGAARGHRWLFGLVQARDQRYDPAQVPSGFLGASAEDVTHFLVAQQNGGRYQGRTLLSAAGIAAMQAPGVPAGRPGVSYGLGWKHASLGGVPTIQHSGDNPYFHGLVLMEPTSRRAAVILVNGNGALPLAAAFPSIEAGVARLLAGQQPEPSSGPGLRQVYLIVDAVLLVVLAVAVVPLVRLPRWRRGLAADRAAGRRRTVRTSVRAALEIALPVLVLAGVRFLLHLLGAQSWAEGLSLFPDVGTWLWVVCLVVLVTGVLRVVAAVAVGREGARGADRTGAPAAPSTPPSSAVAP